MKKKLFTLLICAFAVIGVKAQSISNGVLYINGSSEATFEHIEDVSGYDANNPVTKIVMTGNFSDGWSSGWLTNAGENAPSAITTIDMGGATFGSGGWSFVSFNNLQTIVWPTNGSLKVLPSEAFKKCSIEKLTLASSIEEIKATAFIECSLKEITIPANSNLKYVRTNAFNNCKDIRDVYVNVKPTQTDGSETDTKFGTITYFPWCEAQAFPYDIMENQTAVATGDASKIATLHFDEDYFEFYCGEWKKGLAFTQKNLNLIKDGDGEIGPQNGWQQFAMTGSPSEQVVPRGHFVRTWSSSTPYVIPVYRWEDTSATNPEDRWKSGDIFRCYRATDYTLGGAVTLTKLETVMPANTGMILRSTELNEESALVFMVEATEGKGYDLTEYPYGDTNYLETSIEETEIGPVTLENGKVAYRNFGLYEVSEGNYQFVRYQKGTIRENRAYLKLTAEQFPNNNESATEGPGSGLDEAQSAKISLVFLDEIEKGNEATGINVVNTKKADNTYYNLQGMKVENPSKGIYIYNGKKVIK